MMSKYIPSILCVPEIRSSTFLVLFLSNVYLYGLNMLSQTSNELEKPFLWKETPLICQLNIERKSHTTLCARGILIFSRPLYTLFALSCYINNVNNDPQQILGAHTWPRKLIINKVPNSPISRLCVSIIFNILTRRVTFPPFVHKMRNYKDF